MKPSKEKVLAKKLQGLSWCEDCQGTGKYWHGKAVAKVHKFLKDQDCLRCAGTGWYDAELWKDLGKKTFDKQYVGVQRT